MFRGRISPLPGGEFYFVHPDRVVGCVLVQVLLELHAESVTPAAGVRWHVPVDGVRGAPNGQADVAHLVVPSALEFPYHAGPHTRLELLAGNRQVDPLIDVVPALPNTLFVIALRAEHVFAVIHRLEEIKLKILCVERRLIATNVELPNKVLVFTLRAELHPVKDVTVRLRSGDLHFCRGSIHRRCALELSEDPLSDWWGRIGRVSGAIAAMSPSALVLDAVPHLRV